MRPFVTISRQCGAGAGPVSKALARILTEREMGTPGTDWAGTVTDSAGIQVVVNSVTPLWGTDGAWTLEDVMTIGEAAGDPDYQFGNIPPGGIAVASDGRIYVVDQQAQHIKVFSPDGTFEHTIGQPGSGPGEFGPGVGPILVGRGDSLIVLFSNAHRTIVARRWTDSERFSFRRP